MGLTLKQLSRHEDAIGCWQRTISLAPTFVDAYIAIALVYLDQNELGQAEVWLRKAVAIAPDSVDALINLGLVLHNRNLLDDAIEFCQRAIEVNQNAIEAYVNLGSLFVQKQMPGKARICFEKALDIDPTMAVAKYNLGQTLLLMGDFERGWDFYEARFAWWEQNGASRPYFPQPRWRGEPIRFKTILLSAEQGFGDTLQFIRYAPVLAEKGAQVVVECQPELVTLLRTVPGIARVVARGETLPRFDLWCPMMSLPLAFKTAGYSSVPSEVPYVRANHNSTKVWQARLSKDVGTRVGLVWAGNPRSFNHDLARIDARRSCALSMLTPLFSVPNIRFYSLQKGKTATETKSVGEPLGLQDYTEYFNDFADTAAFVETLDLVISVDTAVAHLAGAMRKPVWLLSRYDGCWRWLIDRDDSPWYPTMRIFRQTKPEDWDSVIERVTEELRKLVADGIPSN